MSFVYSHPFTGLANGLNTINAAGGGVGGWVELGRTTLGSSGSTIDVTSLPDKRYYMVLADLQPTGGNVSAYLRNNNDSGTNYSNRVEANGGTDQTYTSTQPFSYLGPSGATSYGHNLFILHYVANVSDKEKLYINNYVGQNTAGASNAPVRGQGVTKHAQTTNPISQFNMADVSAGSYNTNSELVVLGWDPADSHTNNFWEELASVDLSGGAADQISSGTITAKKYLWVQGYFEDSGGAINQEITFNNDTSNNYAVRHNIDGGSDATSTSRANGYIGVGGIASPNFLNFFIINNASNEKLVIGHDVTQNTAGASTAPRRANGVFKWDNASNQITEIDFDNSAAGSYGTKTIIKVWGAN